MADQGEQLLEVQEIEIGATSREDSTDAFDGKSLLDNAY